MKVPSLVLLRALKNSTRSINQTSCPASKRFFTAKSGTRGSMASVRHIHSSTKTYNAAPKSRDRGPKSSEDTQTDFGSMDILANTAPPATSVEACLDDGFVLGNGTKIHDGSGVLLVGGKAFQWQPWKVEGRESSLYNAKGQWQCEDQAWGILSLVWPKPDLLVLGLGPSMRPISRETRASINKLGISIEVQDTRNAAAQFNLLATERGVDNVAAALIPIGYGERKR